MKGGKIKMQNYKHVLTEQEREAIEQEREFIETQFSEIVDGGIDQSGIRKKCIYAVKFENGFVKIGIAFHPKHRIRSLRLPSGRTVLNFFISRLVSNPTEAESIIREKIKKNHIGDGMYRINFERCVFIIRKLLNPDAYDRNKTR